MKCYVSSDYYWLAVEVQDGEDALSVGIATDRVFPKRLSRFLETGRGPTYVAPYGLWIVLR